jgi:hypothetical protein
MIVQVETEIKKIAALNSFFNSLTASGLCLKYYTPQEIKDHQARMYESLKPSIGGTDAEMIPVAILNGYILLTNDREAIKVFKNLFPELIGRLKRLSFESLLYLAYLKKVINDNESENFLQAYKEKCFDNPARQPKIIRNKNFVQLISQMHEEGISPMKYFS